MDAISFVLGVHSSHLRSQNLKDMIYRSEAMSHSETSSSGRSPRHASVTAVYQNNQGREIRFKRSINSNGNSEYRINDRVVQYSNYNAALEKENILVKAKNFLVFQGDVESVASQNPKDLTRLIEQISGSWEYKDEYDEAKADMEKAIENSAHAFNKKRSLALEIKQYEAQKREVEKFEEKVKDRRECVLQYLLWKLYHIEMKTNSLAEEKDKKYFKSSEAKGQQDSLEYQFKTAREQRALLHREKTRLEVQIRRIQKELEDQLPTSIKSREKLVNFEKKLKQTELNIERVKRDGQQQESVVHSLEKDMELLVATEREYNSSVATTSSGDIPQLTLQQAKDYERRKEEVNNNTAEEQQQLLQYQRQRRTQQQRANELRMKLESLQESEAEILSKIHDAEAEVAEITAEGEKKTSLLESRQAELSQLVDERETIHRREVELNDKLQKTLTKLLDANLTLQDTENDSKFNNSIATMKQIYPNVHGKLSDLCRPTQRKYDTAIATVFGRNMDAIVVEDEATAIECIRHMKEQHIPTATFLPLHSLSVPSINQNLSSLVKGVRLAFDLVKFDSQYEQVVRYACGNTVVCDNLSIAKRVCFDMNESVRAVTLDGTVIHPSGLMTGGSAPTQPVTKWHESEVEEYLELMKQRDEYLAELNNISMNKRMGSLEDSVRNDCARLQAQVDSLKDDLLATNRKIEGLNGTLQDIRNKINEAKQPLGEAEIYMQQLDQKIASVRERIAEVEDQVFEDFCALINVANIREYEAMLQNGSDEVSERRAQFASQKQRLETQLDFEKEQLNELVKRLQSLEASYNSDTTAKSQIEAELNGMSGRKESLTERLEICKQELERKAREEEDKQKEINDISNLLEVKGRDVKQILKEVGTIETEISKYYAERVAIFRKCKLEGINLPMLQGSMDDIVVEGEQISQAEGMATDDSSVSSSMDVDEPPSQTSILTSDWTIEIDYARLGQLQRDDSSQAVDKDFQDEIKRLTDEIEQMAPNLKAVDRLESVEESLKVAEDEFSVARNTAKAAKERFNMIKQKRFSLFYDAFSHISEHIDRVYKDLTKSETFPLGGTAYLSLEDTEEPYLEGIKYHAMPPMKRFRDMEQLSGGEKSVAALALLFAVHSYKPSPFFVLDEVDAALDNANVSTVASYIREHATDEFQFIVISLKQLLYEKAQSLVGIYRDQGFNSSKTMTLMLDQYQS
ncbi:RecF/RecN/SMC protein [Rhizopus microsporus ATCC 52813]|uniref:Structural maintenance of chromosomes protein n=1 Tax=Rhizopus microsporus ATCC 52813 TaxID=1340429 RepID=A0A2G4SJC8_RHIZD|nr:RecF/RecN/SMC protein [Rhizopus microsporus ATCC 52813]PHZ08880.1 RecF/RecN/SMC protein [Rhizopus microsporus ATCC 52813]